MTNTRLKDSAKKSQTKKQNEIDPEASKDCDSVKKKDEYARNSYSNNDKRVNLTLSELAQKIVTYVESSFVFSVKKCILEFRKEKDTDVFYYLSMHDLYIEFRGKDKNSELEDLHGDLKKNHGGVIDLGMLYQLNCERIQGHHDKPFVKKETKPK